MSYKKSYGRAATSAKEALEQMDSLQTAQVQATLKSGMLSMQA